jgi:rhamnopyranosyl-N-acetylglucosaminyl-diphospho-decaprenol beta-1,3/1,4-galactofuranosyltransferase
MSDSQEHLVSWDYDGSGSTSRTEDAPLGAPTQGATNPIERLAIVVVTYKRQKLLGTLFESIEGLQTAPWRVIVVDNEHSAQTETMVADFSQKLTNQWGLTEPDEAGGVKRVVYAPQAGNIGGSGGFSNGVKQAYELGAEWFWVMDDDVAVLPDAIEKLSKWTPRHDVIQGSRLDYDGGPFYWQYDFIVPLGIPNPIAPAAFGPSGCRHMNTMCFEGALFRRNIVELIGLPDPRFFIYWDDTMYGYLASRVTEPIVVADHIIRRTRNISNWDIAGVRQLNSTSDMNRYHIMRNRGYMARYFMTHGDYRPALFGLGTALTAVKEVIRLVAVDHGHFVTGLRSIAKGWVDSRKLLHDPNWQPMPPLE